LFFKGIQLYLTQNAFGIADIHDLRKAFEKASGEDLNWYFNQWMIGFGHPDLLVDYQYNTSKKELQVKVKQRQDASIGVFKIPSTIAYGSDSLHKTIVPVVFDSAEQTFSFPVAASEMAYVTIDESGVLLADIEEHKSPVQWANQMKWAGAYGNFLRAYHQFKDSKDSVMIAFLPALADKYLMSPNWVYQQYGLALLDKQTTMIQQRQDYLKYLALNHPKSKFRCEALQILSNLKQVAVPVLQAALNDSSYLVNARALLILNDIQPDLAYRTAQAMEQVYNADVQEAVSRIYANASQTGRLKYFTLVLGKFRNKRFVVFNNFGKYLGKHLVEEGYDGLQLLSNYAKLTSDRDIHQRVDKLMTQYTKQLEELMKQGRITENGYNTIKASIMNLQDWAKSGLEG
jgi:aminopeptidase N